MKSFFCELYRKFGKLFIVFLIEIIFLIFSIINIFLPKNTYSFDIPEFHNEYKVSVENQKFGRYKYKAEYVEEQDSLYITVDSVNNNFINGHVNVEGQVLRSAYTEGEGEYWVTGFKNDVEIKIFNMNPDINERITRIDVKETNFSAYVLTILSLCLLLITYFIYFVIKGGIDRQTGMVICALCGITVLAALPVFTPYLQMGADAVFHLNRIEGIKESLLCGQFPVRVESIYLNGYGYAVSTFYGSLFFYIPVIARLIGFSLQFSYKILILFLNIIMVINSYFFFKKITKERKWGVLGCFCFTLFTYKFINMYSRAAISEASALAVLPLIANIFYDIFTKEHDKEYKKLWIKLTLAFSLVLENHIISTEIFGITMILICVFYFKKTFNKDTFMVLLKFTLCTIILNAFFLVPFIDTITKMKFNINSWEGVTGNIQGTGYSVLDWFYMDKPQYDCRIWYEHVIKIIPGISAPLMFLSAFVAVLSGVFKSKYKKIFKFFFIESIVIIVITSSYFPWDSAINFMIDNLGSLGFVVSNMITNIQFLFRLTILADLFFTGLFVITIKYLTENYRNTTKSPIKQWIPKLLIIIVISVTLIQTLSLETAVIATQYNSKYQKFGITESDELFCKNIGNEEYIPRTLVTGWSWSDAYNDRKIVVTGGEAYNYSKKGTTLNFTVKTQSDVTAWIDIPLIYYFGYEAYNSDTKETIQIFQNNSGKISFVMPGDTTWNVELVYKDKKSWIIADIVSLITLISIFGVSVSGVIIRNSKKKEKLL